MNTKYSEIVELVVHLMNEYKIYDDLVENRIDKLVDIFKPFIKIACAEIENTNFYDWDIKRNDEQNEFENEFSDGQQLIIAKFVVISYLTWDTNDILRIGLNLQDGDFKTYAEKNNLDGKLNLINTLQEDVHYNMTTRDYKFNSPW